MNTDQFTQLLAARGRKLAKTPGGWLAQCPAHDDQNPSLSISAGDDGRVLLKCHAHCTAEAICTALGIRFGDLFPDKPRPAPASQAKSRVVATYAYRDEAGVLLYESVRYEPKEFRQRRPDPADPGRRIWSLNGVRRVLFRLPEIIEGIARRQTIFVAEGEKDVLALVAQGFCATCNSGGAKKWLPGHSESLRGASVVVIADKDQAGREHADLVARSLQGIADGVKVLELPDTGGKAVKDAHDYFAAGGTAAAFNELVAKSLPWAATGPAPAAEAMPDAELEAPLDVPLDWQEIFDFKPDEDPNCLLGQRWLTRSSSCFWIGQSGIGKSTLNIQAAIQWAIGKPFAGVVPKRPLRSVIIQAENDTGDVAEMIQGVCRGYDLPVTQFPMDRVKIYRITAVSGLEFIRRVERIVEWMRPDLLWIDPLLQYFGEDVSKQKEAAEFCAHLTAMQERTGVCTMLVHHTGKPKETKAQAGWTSTDYSYIGLGSSVLTNWARAVVVLQRLREQQEVYSLTFAKRGKRAGIRTEDGEPVTQIYLEQSRRGQFWEPSDYERPGEGRMGRPVKFSIENIVANLPENPPMTALAVKKWLMTYCTCSKATAYNKFDEMLGIYITLDTNGFVVKKERV